MRFFFHDESSGRAEHYSTLSRNRIIVYEVERNFLPFPSSWSMCCSHRDFGYAVHDVSDTTRRQGISGTHRILEPALWELTCFSSVLFFRS